MYPGWLRRTLPLLAAVSCSLAVRASYAGASLPDCHVGAYRLSDHSMVDIAPADEGRLRWRRFDGTSGALTRSAAGDWHSTLGWTGRPDGKVVRFSDCSSDAIDFAGVRGHRIALVVRETSIERGGITLAARLVLPPGKAAVPVVVLVHGSESLSAREFYALQRILPAAGIGVLVYDKRGTGASGGTFTMDFSVLADDAVAAMRSARQLAGARLSRIGYYGTSQGGWVAPLAASRASVDFVIVGYGLAVSPLEEDQQEAALDMSLHGFGPEETAKALEVARAAEEVLQSGVSEPSLARFREVRGRYQQEPWFRYLHGNVTYLVLTLTPEQLRAEVVPMLAGVSWNYDPLPVLRAQQAPNLWILGSDDLEAPCAPTAARLKQVAEAGAPFTVAIFPRTEHGIFEYETAATGERADTRNADGFFAMIRDFALQGSLHGSYGSSVVRPPG
jgi:pimeloyl-ACP methyl ester carboxylesterase